MSTDQIKSKERFPEDFMFRLTDAEVDFMVSQNAIPSRKHLGGSLPYAFSEQGVASLAGVLRSEKAAEIHVKIMREFYLVYRDDERVQPLVAQIGWSHNLEIFQHCKNPQICRFAAVSSSRPHFVSQMDADCLVPKEREKQYHQLARIGEICG